MCIIIAKTRNGRLPKEEELKNSFYYNSDGAGFMYVNNGKVVIDKGYMDYDKFIEKYRELCKRFYNFKNKAFVIHCRIGTSSINSAENTHPYPITRKEKRLHKTYFETDLGVVHNGIITDYTPTWKNPTTNDTQEFIIKYLTPLYENYKDFYKNKYIMDGIEEIIGSKLVFLNTNEELYFVGKKKFINDNNLYFSNDTYQDRIYDYGYYNYGSNYWKNWGSSKNNYDYYDDFDDYDDYGNFNKLKKLEEEQESEEEIVYEEELSLLDSEWYIVSEHEYKKIDNEYTYCNFFTGDLYEEKDNKFIKIGNIYEESIEIYTEDFELVV